MEENRVEITLGTGLGEEVLFLFFLWSREKWAVVVVGPPTHPGPQPSLKTLRGHSKKEGKGPPPPFSSLPFPGKIDFLLSWANRKGGGGKRGANSPSSYGRGGAPISFFFGGGAMKEKRKALE